MKKDELIGFLMVIAGGVAQLFLYIILRAYSKVFENAASLGVDYTSIIVRLFNGITLILVFTGLFIFFYRRILKYMGIEIKTEEEKIEELEEEVKFLREKIKELTSKKEKK